MATTTLDKRIVSAQLDSSMADELEQLAANADRSLSAEVRRAIAEHLARARSRENEEED